MNAAARSAWVIAAALLAAALASHALIAAAPARIAPDLAQPLAIVTDWGAFGALLLAILCAALVAGTPAYFTALRSGGRGVLVPCAAALGAAWLMPVTFSSDVYAYAAYGEMMRLGMNPYGHSLLPHANAVFEAAIWQWGNPPPACVYGPSFVALAAALTWALHAAGTLAILDGFRLIACASLLGCAALAARAYPGSARERAAAAAAIGLNPVAIWCAAEGHNDAVALLVVLAGFTLLRYGAPVAGAAVAALAGTVKLPGALAALPLLRAPQTRWGAVAGLLAATLLSVPFAVGVATHVAPQGRFAPEASLQAFVKPLLEIGLRSDGLASGLTLTIAAAVAASLAAGGIRLLRDGRREGWLHVALGAWVLVPNPYPWYGLWFAAVAALAPATRAGKTLLALVLFSLLRYAPDAVAAPAAVQAAALGAFASLPLLAMIRLRVRRIGAR